MIPVIEALARLRDGNERFIKGETRQGAARRNPADVAFEQQPFAVVLGCSDSRVPVEIIFDQGPGDLFVIRVAGNIVASSQVGSVEFAAAQFGVRLVVVMGHTRCGAIQATLEELQRPNHNQSPNLRSIVNRIRPSVEGLLDTDLKNDPAALTAHAIRSNVRVSANQLRHGSGILESLIESGDLLIVGAEYCLDTGVVEFFDGAPQ